jgi:hypothetical protein
LAEEKIVKQDLRLKQYQHQNQEIYNLKIELLEAKEKKEDLEKIILHLENTCQKLNEENMFLVRE